MTNGCIDKKLGEKLYAWEMGLLSDAEREEFELHLLECGYCNQRARDFQQEARMIRQDEQLRETVAELDASSAAGSLRSRTRIVSIAVAAAAVLVLLLLKPWQLEFRPTQEAVARENRLIVMNFENLVDAADSSRLGEIIPNLLITDLSASKHLSIVSRQRLEDLLKLTGHAPDAVLKGREALELARRASANWMLTGAVVQVEPTLIVTAQVVVVASGDVLGSSRIEAKPDESMFSVVDRLTVDIKTQLSLPLSALDEPDPAVANVTTHSPEAYYHYVEGIRASSQLYYPEAAEHFRKAIEIDSTFAMAYYYLSLTLNDTTPLSQAVKYADHVSERERLYIQSVQALARHDYTQAENYLLELVKDYPDEKVAWFRLGKVSAFAEHIHDAIKYYRKAIEIDPLYTGAYNELVYAYMRVGDDERALQTADAYVAIAPDQPNPYDTRGEALARQGRLDDALASYRRSVEIKPDFVNYSSLFALGRLHAYEQQFDSALACFQRIVIDSDNRAIRSYARTYMGLILVYQGRFREAMDLLSDGIAADRMELATAGIEGSRSYKHYIRAMMFAELGDYDQAYDDGSRATGLQDSVRQPLFRCTFAAMMAEEGRFELAHRIAEILRKEMLAGADYGQSAYYFAEGGINLARGEADKAVASFQRSLEGGDYYDTRFMLARSYFEAGRYLDAIDMFRSIDRNYQDPMRFVFAIWSVKTHYYLGRCYEQIGEPGKAIAEYETFLDIWRNADLGIKVIDDARARLGRLQG